MLSMCCTERYCTCWGSRVKYNSPSTKWFLKYLRRNSKSPKKVSCLCTTQTEDRIFVRCFFNESFSSTLAYMSQPYAEAMAIRPAVSYITDAASSKEKTGDIIVFTQFEEGNLLSETRNNTESGNEYDDDSTLATIISEEETDVMSSRDESDAETMHTDMLEDITDGSQSHRIINTREARYKIRNRF